ncbi:TPA: response regulator transcription factor [Salmonella enterica]|uniref:Response regulator transcription factor n=1 Tax=Salmonella enterica TaxID=28901 RepID=A0A764KZ54_SALER|nr:response regulator transcription factor [Salmonella enterica]HAG4941159.1 response regulator transcription factor [Salmonella enterica]HAG5004689.1 response regulator transcription factor [Salmonella enterica]
MNTKMVVNDDENLIFLVSQCSYLLYGLSSLMTETDCRVSVIPVSHPEEILSYPEGRYKRRLIVVSLPTAPVQSAKGRVFLWRLDIMRMQGRLSGPIHCVLTGDREKWHSCVPAYRWLPKESGPATQDILFRALMSPGWSTVPARPRHLTHRQECILKDTLAGNTVQEIAEKLNLTERAVFSARSAMISRIGLNNRIELMGLTGGASDALHYITHDTMQETRFSQKQK